MISMRWRIYENEANDCTKVTIEKRAWGDNNEGGREREKERERAREKQLVCMHAYECSPSAQARRTPKPTVQLYLVKVFVL